MEMEKQRMEMFINYEDEDEEEYDEEYKEQFRSMTGEEIERHIGLIRRMIEEIKNEEKQPEPEDEEYESDSFETQRMERLQWIRDNRKPKIT